jgi:hypothetical protein
VETPQGKTRELLKWYVQGHMNWEIGFDNKLGDYDFESIPPAGTPPDLSEDTPYDFIQWLVGLDDDVREATIEEAYEAIGYVCNLDLEHDEYHTVLYQIVTEDNIEWDTVAYVGGGDDE